MCGLKKPHQALKVTLTNYFLWINTNVSVKLMVGWYNTVYTVITLWAWSMCNHGT